MYIVLFKAYCYYLNCCYSFKYGYLAYTEEVKSNLLYFNVK